MSDRVLLQKPFFVSAALRQLLDRIAQHQGKSIIVGGSVRDHLLGLSPKDIDIEVYNLDADVLEQMLADNFSYVAVGKSFGIFKVTIRIGEHAETFDVALPRTENKEGRGHKGFMVALNPQLTFKDASSRRDFTINAMGIDVQTNELIDPHGGFSDLYARRLRHVSEAFNEDPLRVLRAAQFCARFDLRLDDDTRDLCRSLTDELKTLSKERIYEEFKKLLLAKKPSIGLEVLRSVNALELFPELALLIGCEQDEQWHPEGDVWTHSLMVTDQAANIIREHALDEDTQLIVMLGALCHDLGKPYTSFELDGRIKSPGHEQAGVEPTLSFLAKIGFPPKFYDDVTALVKDHLKPFQLYKIRDEISDGALRRLACRVNIDQLLMVSRADFLGRTTKDALAGYDPSAPWLKARITEVLGAALKPEPIVLGRHLISLGYTPGPNFSKILSVAFEAQLDGEFSDEASAIIWLKNYLQHVS